MGHPRSVPPAEGRSHLSKSPARIPGRTSPSPAMPSGGDAPFELRQAVPGLPAGADAELGNTLRRFRGIEAEAAPLIEAVITAARAAGQGVAVQWSQWAAAILCNGLGRYEKALAEAQAAERAAELYTSMWALPELIEAASRTGHTRLAADALSRLAEATSVGQTDWGQGIHARSRALLSDGEVAERQYREAIGRLSRTRLRPDLARGYLLYGEWLRREGRRTDAREELRTAYDMLDAIGMEAFAERARPGDQASANAPRGAGDDGDLAGGTHHR